MENQKLPKIIPGRMNRERHETGSGIAQEERRVHAAAAHNASLLPPKGSAPTLRPCIFWASTFIWKGFLSRISWVSRFTSGWKSD
jgi:hypothetical protein